MMILNPFGRSRAAKTPSPLLVVSRISIARGEASQNQLPYYCALSKGTYVYAFAHWDFHLGFDSFTMLA
jgi:hypothetical protein